MPENGAGGVGKHGGAESTSDDMPLPRVLMYFSGCIHGLRTRAALTHGLTSSRWGCRDEKSLDLRESEDVLYGT